MKLTCVILITLQLALGATVDKMKLTCVILITLPLALGATADKRYLLSACVDDSTCLGLLQTFHLNGQDICTLDSYKMYCQRTCGLCPEFITTTPKSVCSIRPCVHGTCNELPTGAFQCTCNTGYHGFLCDKACMDDPKCPVLLQALQQDGLDVCTEDSFKVFCNKTCGLCPVLTTTTPTTPTCKDDSSCPALYQTFQQNGQDICMEDSFKVFCNKTCGLCTGLITTTQKNACSVRPCLHGTCSLLPTGAFHCTCNTAYQGFLCDKVDACVSSPCIHGVCHTASNGTAVCTCNPGYTGDHCNYTDPCLTLSPCSNGGTCIPTPTGSFRCVCTRGHTGLLCDQSLLFPTQSNVESTTQKMTAVSTTLTLTTIHTQTTKPAPTAKPYWLPWGQWHCLSQNGACYLVRFRNCSTEIIKPCEDLDSGSKAHEFGVCSPITCPGYYITGAPTTSTKATTTTQQEACHDAAGTNGCQNPLNLYEICREKSVAWKYCAKSCNLCDTCWDYLDTCNTSIGLFCGRDDYAIQYCRQTCGKCSHKPVAVNVNSCGDVMVGDDKCDIAQKEICICKDPELRALCKNYCAVKCQNYPFIDNSCTTTKRRKRDEFLQAHLFK